MKQSQAFGIILAAMYALGAATDLPYVIDNLREEDIIEQATADRMEDTLFRILGKDFQVLTEDASVEDLIALLCLIVAILEDAGE